MLKILKFLSSNEYDKYDESPKLVIPCKFFIFILIALSSIFSIDESSKSVVFIFSKITSLSL